MPAPPKSSVGFWVVHLNIVVYAFAFWVTNPSMPYLLRELGATSLSFGVFASVFNVIQLLGGLTVGNLQDRYTSSAALNITQAGSLLVYITVFFSTSLTMMYVSRLPTVLQQCMQVAQAYISKSTSLAARTVALSRLSLSYGAGMIAGSTVSGYVVEYAGTRATFIVAGAATAVMLLVNLVFLREKSSADGELKAAGTSAATAASGAGGPITWRTYIGIVRSLLPELVFLAMLFATRAMFETVNNLMLVDQFAVRPEQMGSLLSFFAAVSFVSNVALLPLALKYASEANVTRGSLVGSMIAYVAAAFAVSGSAVAKPNAPDADGGAATATTSLLTSILDSPSATLYITALTFLSAFSTALYTSSTTTISKGTNAKHHGQAVALSHALRSAVGIVCPIVASVIFSTFSGSAVAAANVVLLAAALVLQKK